MPIALLPPAWPYLQSSLLDLRLVLVALALIAGAAAILSPRGQGLRPAARSLFFVSMLVLSAVGADLALFDADPGAVIASVLIGYLTATAWTSARRPSGGVFDVGALLVVLGLAAVAISLSLLAGEGTDGSLGGSRALTYLSFAGFAGLAGIADLRLILSDRMTVAAKAARSRWRAGAALAIAASWFVVDGRGGRLALVGGVMVLGCVVLVQLALWWARGRRPAPAVGEGASLEPR